MVWAAGKRNLLLYDDDGIEAGQDHERVQDALTVTVTMFHRMGLDTNPDKTKAVVCMPRFI